MALAGLRCDIALTVPPEVSWPAPVSPTPAMPDQAGRARALVESADGVTGWWRRLCSNQVTNCS